MARKTATHAATVLGILYPANISGITFATTFVLLMSEVFLLEHRCFYVRAHKTSVIVKARRWMEMPLVCACCLTVDSHKNVPKSATTFTACYSMP